MPLILKQLVQLWRRISLRRRRQFGLLLILMLFVSLSEVLSIGAVFPFISVLTAPERVFENPAIKPLIKNLGLSRPDQLLLPLTITFASAALVAGAMRLFLLWASTRLSFGAGADLSIDVYRRTLYQPYAVHCARNSSEIIDGIAGKTNVVIYNVVTPVLHFVSSVIVVFVILFFILTFEPAIAFAAVGGFGLIYMVIMKLTRKRLLIDSQRVSVESIRVIKSIQEGLGGIRDVLIDGSQPIYCRIYRESDLSLRRAQGNNLFISSSPRFLVEALGMVSIAIVAYFLRQRADGVSNAISILGILALGAQRLLPVLQQAYSAWSTIQGAQSSLRDTLELLAQPLPDYANSPNCQPIKFKKEIRINNLNFSYTQNDNYVISGVNLTIKKGEKVGFIGTTGSGKSTLIDIVMGLLQPSSGTIEIDGEVLTVANHRAWQSHIAHVPQTIYLADSSIEENIAFGVAKEKIDRKRVREAAAMAQIANCIESWPTQYRTFVGERGIRLSGGQRQRLGIARALYKQADVIIFDEATSALDNYTEQAVMTSIEKLNQNVTVLIIAHRITTLRSCSKIVELSDGKVKKICKYTDIINSSQS
jgi:ABC-type multidrug transport system fused ATPase/permease subunit